MKLNCDLGEGSGNDAALMPLIDQASVACGGHAGDRQSMMDCVVLAAEHGVQLGAHPAYPDRESFGRRSLTIAPASLAASLRQQVARLAKVAAAAGQQLAYIKPHGALYHDIWTSPELCAVVLKLAVGLELPLVVQAGRGALPVEPGPVQLWKEAFADRAYAVDGSLVARGEAGALLDASAAAAQTRCLLAQRAVIAIDGTRLPVQADTLCLHGDHPQAIAIGRAVRQALS